MTNAQISEILVKKEGNVQKAHEAMLNAGLLKSKQKLTNAELQQTIATKIGNEEDAKAIMASMGLSVAIEGEEAQTVQLTAKKLQLAVTSGLLTKAQAQEIAMTAGVTMAQKAQIGSVMPQWIANMKAMTSATWAQVRATVAWLATNPAGWAILAVGGIATVISILKKHEEKLEEQCQKIRELGETARSEIDSINSNFASTKSTVDDVAQKYATLAQEVGNLGKASQNQGTLSNDEYAEFLDISNQLSDLFPRLTNGYDDNGNAILNLSGNVDTITSSLYDLVDAEKAAASVEMQEKMGNIWGEYSLNVSDYSEKYNQIFEKKKDIEHIYDEITSGVDFTTIPYADEILEQAKLNMFDSNGNRLFYNWDDLSEIQKNAINNAYHELYNETLKTYDEEMRTLSQKIESSNKDFSSYLVSSLQGTDYYEELGEYKSIVNGLLSNYGYDTELNTLRGSENWDEAFELIKADIIDPFKSLSEKDKQVFQEYYNKLLSIDPEAALADNIPEIAEYISKLAELLGIDENKLQIALGYDLSEDENKLNTAKNRMGYIADPKTSSDANRNKMIDEVANTLDKADIELLTKIDIPEESKDWVKEEWFNFIEELSNNTEVDITANPTKPLDSIKNAYSGFESIYEDIRNGTTVAADSIEALNDAFGELDGGTALEEFKDVLTTMPDDIDAQQEALNNLATTYLDNSDLIKNLTEDNADYTVSELKKMNVINAEEVVQSRLYNQEKNFKDAQEEQKSIIDSLTNSMSSATSATDILAASKYKAMATSIDLNNASANEIAGLINAANAAGVDSTALKNLIADKIRAGQIVLTTNGDISNLIALCQTLGGTVTYLQKYSQAKYTISQGGTINGGGTADVQMLKGLEALAKNELNKALSNFGGGNTANVQYSVPSYSPSNSGTGGSGDSSASAETKPEVIDWTEINLQRLEEELSRLDKKSSNVYSLWSQRNSALNEQIAKTRQEILSQQNAYDYYMAKANSIGLSDTYVSKVQNGTIQIEDITDEDLADKISQYQTWYEKAIKCKDTIQGLNISLGDLADQKFDNLQTEYDGVISVFESFGNLTEETIRRTEEHGYFVAKDSYKQLINNENKTLNTLQQQYASLIQSRDEALKSGAVTENSQEWYKMTKSILDVEYAIEQSKTSIVKFDKEIRELDWEIFDYTEERIKQITKESDYLIELMEKHDLYNETGAFTSEGKAVTALHGINYNTYMQQALDYANKLKDIEQEISEDSANKDLINRRDELLDLQQAAITNAEAEKEAIKSLVEEGINIHLDALSSLIDKYKDAMDSAKDLYDYQKNISSQVKEISSLEKQILAYEGDDSEEARKIIQETKLSLEEARTELKETEWDKYISETEQLLDALYNDYEEVLNARLDNIDALVAGMIDMVNSNGSEIRSTIEAVADKVGYTISDSLSKALGEGSNVNILISNFSTKFDTVATTLQDSINAIKSYVYKMIEEGKHKVDDETKIHTSNDINGNPISSSSGIGNSISREPTSSPDPSSTASDSGDGTARIGDAVIFANGKYHEDSWGNGKSGNQLLGGVVYITKIAPNSPYPYHISRTSKFGEANLGWVKLNQLNGYTNGSKKINQNQLAWTQENGNEIIYRSTDGALLTPLNNGDMVFTNEMAQKLWEMAKGNISVPAFNSHKINTNSDRGNNTVHNDNKIAITLPNVKNYNEFKSELQKDTRFVNFVQEVTLGEALGHNSMRSKKF